jgi:hypothetical protein
VGVVVIRGVAVYVSLLNRVPVGVLVGDSNIIVCVCVFVKVQVKVGVHV